jgi:hypothetical protein
MVIDGIDLADDAVVVAMSNSGFAAKFSRPPTLDLCQRIWHRSMALKPRSSTRDTYRGIVCRWAAATPVSVGG